MVTASRLNADRLGARDAFQDAAHIPKLTHTESGKLATVELEQFLALVESLSDEDWGKPTVCTLWSVKDILAHQAGACAGHANWYEFKRQYLHNPYMRTQAVRVDGINKRQVEDRAARTSSDLIAELRQVGPRAIATRQWLPVFLRALRIPIRSPMKRLTRVDYLTDILYPRDMWMHRLDICRAAGREMIQTAEHDGRIVALIVRELADILMAVLDGASVVYDLGGTSGGTYRIGRSTQPAATIRMDVVDFNLLASSRLTAADVVSNGLASISGDIALSKRTLAYTTVMY